ncbi:MAG: hypothetical protein QOH89_1779 [Pseudonocardiales bacterium]|jgi:uncharacterized membrane protein YgcG|nr:hypothetical protein [Pseudonocardiales bacterium]
MAQRKPTSGGKPAAKKGTSRPAGKPGTGPAAGKTPAAKAGAASSAKAAGSLAKAGAASSAARKKPPTKPGKSIVNQKQTPWGMIATVAAVVAFAAAVIIVVVVTHKSSADNSDRYKLPELAAAKDIKGVLYHVEPQHNHVDGTVEYDRTPPTGGNHNPYYADCNGIVYAQAIANENAVHPLEHGAVWVTYREGLPANDVTTLATNVTGQDHVFMSPYPKLKSKVSLQAWGYQLFVDSVSDPRIPRFIAALAANPAITPEVDSAGQAASCTNPGFSAAPSTFGRPISAPQAPISASPSSSAGSSSAGSSSGTAPASGGAGSSAP